MQCILFDYLALMKKHVLFVLTLVFSANALSQTFNWHDIGKDMQYASEQLDLITAWQSISILRYKSSKYRTEIVNDPAEMADSISALADRHGALGAINGSYFDVRQLTPATFVIDDGVQEGWTAQSEEYRTDGVVAIKGKHKVIISQSIPKRSREVLASGPLLLQGGKPVKDEWPKDSFFSSRHPRTIMGTLDGWVYFIVVDGRAPGKAAGMTIQEAVNLALFLGLENAINLDGGGSSTLWTRSLGVISNPCDNRKFNHFGQRAVPNAVIVR